MRYQGGKGALAKHIAPLILNFAKGRRILEPFCGGLSMTALLQPAVASDWSPVPITLAKAIRAGWLPNGDLTEEEYRHFQTRRKEVNDPDVCFAGQGATFGGKWFGGYARGHERQRFPVRAAANSLLNRLDKCRETNFLNQPYWELEVLPGDVVYCDPPYKNTSQDYPTPESFDHDRFWNWARDKADGGADVFISEFSAPSDIALFWEKSVALQTRKTGVSEKIERLYHIPAKIESEEIIKMTYPKLSVEQFGRALIDSGDLDPLYIAFVNCPWAPPYRARWLLAYWCFYHAGAASYIADAENESFFWKRMYNAARNETETPIGGRWPRASERRHFRGQKAIDAVAELSRQGVGSIFNMLIDSAPSYSMLAQSVDSLPQFGPWMAFKIADMLERCLEVPVEFDLRSVTMFDDPKKAALMVARERMKLAEGAKFKDPAGVIRGVVEHLIHEFRDLSAPPLRDRPIGYQEVETVLCKWKSHMNGHYPVGKDTREIGEGLKAWAEISPTAAELRHWLPKPPS